MEPLTSFRGPATDASWPCRPRLRWQRLWARLSWIDFPLIGGRRRTRFTVGTWLPFGNPFNVLNRPELSASVRSNEWPHARSTAWGRKASRCCGRCYDGGRLIGENVRGPICRPSPYHLAMPPQRGCGAGVIAQERERCQPSVGSLDPHLAARFPAVTRFWLPPRYQSLNVRGRRKTRKIEVAAHPITPANLS